MAGLRDRNGERDGVVERGVSSRSDFSERLNDGSAIGRPLLRDDEAVTKTREEPFGALIQVIGNEPGDRFSRQPQLCGPDAAACVEEDT